MQFYPLYDDINVCVTQADAEFILDFTPVICIDNDVEQSITVSPVTQDEAVADFNLMLTNNRNIL